MLWCKYGVNQVPNLRPFLICPKGFLNVVSPLKHIDYSRVMTRDVSIFIYYKNQWAKKERNLEKEARNKVVQVSLRDHDKKNCPLL